MLNLIFKRFLICILALSLSIGMLTGCAVRIPDSKFQKGDFVQQIGCFGIGTPIAASSKTDTFPIDNVSFEFYYAFNELGQGPDYEFYDSNYDHFVVVLCVCDIDDYRTSSAFNDYYKPYDDYKNIPYNYFIREITDEEIFADKYSYQTKFDGEFVYKHSEIVKIPENIFNHETGDFNISLRCFNFNENEAGYITSFSFGLGFHYEKINNKTVKLDFEKNKIYVPF